MTDRDRVILGAMTSEEILAELARLRRIVAAATHPAFVAWVEGQARVSRAGQRAAVNLAARRNGVEAERMSRSAREFGGHGDMLDAFLAAVAGPQATETTEPPAIVASSRWDGESLIWTIDGRDMSDGDLRAWCFAHLDYPDCHVGPCVLRKHVEAWANHMREATDAE